MLFFKKYIFKSLFLINDVEECMKGLQEILSAWKQGQGIDIVLWFGVYVPL